MSTIQRRTIVFRSFTYFLRSHVSLILGIAAATAVIVGALVIGDCMRGSLTSLVLQRLANTVLLMHSRHYFDPALLDKADVAAIDASLSLAPLIHLTNCSAEKRTEEASSQSPLPSFDVSEWASASNVQLFAIDERFVKAVDPDGKANFPAAPGMDEILVNESFAKELRLNVGDEVTLRFGHNTGVPADNPLGRRDRGSMGLPRQKVVGILSDRFVGGLNLQITQQAALNVFASLRGLQDLLDLPDKVNSAMVFSKEAGLHADARELDWAGQASQRLRPKLEDYGLQFQRLRRIFPDEERGESSDLPRSSVYDYFQLSSKDLLIDEWTATSVMESLNGIPHHRSMTYLANTVGKIESVPFEMQRQSSGRRSVGEVQIESIDVNSPSPMVSRVVPYSIVVGVDPQAADLDWYQYAELSLRDLRSPYCLINSWLAAELEVQPGDWLQMQFYNPETVDGELKESFVRLMVIGIVPVERPKSPFRRTRPAMFDRPPTRFNDPNLTPTVPGITNQESIANWDVPFELKERRLILAADDQYWEEHRLTPKIFIPYSYARNFFYSRFGATTAIQIPIPNMDSADTLEMELEVRRRIEEGLLAARTQAGFVFQPVRYRQLTAAAGTTPFDLLFLSLSFFVIAAALMLVALLFKLGFQQRVSQIGLLYALGFTPRQIGRMILQEMSLVACLGAMVGIPLGLVYAGLLIKGLESWWIGVIQTRFLQFFVTPQSLLVGAMMGAVTSLLTIFFGSFSVSKAQPLNLLRGDTGDSLPSGLRSGGVELSLAGVTFLAALMLGVYATGELGMTRAACFFGSGMLLLFGGLALVRAWLNKATNSSRAEKQGLGSLAFRAIVRNPVRSSLSIGLLAVASFLIASMSVFQISPSERGYGGFDLIGISNQPIYDNLGSPKARKQAIGSSADEILGSTIIPIRMSEGDDASCVNLYQVARPTILGVSERLHKLSELTDSFKFSWAATTEPESPWRAIQYAATGDRGMPIPVILDQNTAMWSLKQGGSLTALIQIEIDGRNTYFQVVGLLSDSVLQGKLMISERNFERLFPKISGYRYFMIKSGDNLTSDAVARVLEKGWSEQGLDVTASSTILDRLLSVQNTYISAFQSLGALGLLLGTIGLIAVQLRSILERRKELALMQAVGFPQIRLVQLLSLETIILLGSGLLLGVSCSAIALVPYLVDAGPQVSVLSPLIMLGMVLCCGLVAAGISARMALRLPLLPSLRSE